MATERRGKMDFQQEDYERDPHNLQRFLDAQQESYARALREIRQGEKQSHWMWYVFPQLEGLGGSGSARKYAIRSLDEAEAYLAHSMLGARLVESMEAVLGVQGRTARQLLGYPDDLKLRSCATLFLQVAPPDSVFGEVLTQYYEGAPDDLTLRLLDTQGG